MIQKVEGRVEGIQGSKQSGQRRKGEDWERHRASAEQPCGEYYFLFAEKLINFLNAREKMFYI